MAGPFFSEGTFTKNSVKEVDAMLGYLAAWSTAAGRVQFPTETEALAADPGKLLMATDRPIELPKYMGRWYGE